VLPQVILDAPHVIHLDFDAECDGRGKLVAVEGDAVAGAPGKAALQAEVIGLRQPDLLESIL
jgi:hypothetical protein